MKFLLTIVWHVFSEVKCYGLFSFLVPSLTDGSHGQRAGFEEKPEKTGHQHHGPGGTQKRYQEQPR